MEPITGTPTSFNMRLPTWLGQKEAWFKPEEDMPPIRDFLNPTIGDALLEKYGLNFEWGTRKIWAADRLMDRGADANPVHHAKRVEACTRNDDIIRGSGWFVANNYTFEGHQPIDMIRFFAELEFKVNALADRGITLEFKQLSPINYGRQIFAAAKLKGATMRLFDGEEQAEPWVCFTTGIGQSTRLWLEAVMLSCANAFPTKFNDKTASAWSHRSRATISNVHTDIADPGFLENRDDFDHFAVEMGEDDRYAYFLEVLWKNRGTLYQLPGHHHGGPKNYRELSRLADRAQVRETKDRTAAERTAIAGRKRLLKHLVTISNIYSVAPGQDSPARRGKIWGALNAIIYWLDHDKPERPTIKKDGTRVLGMSDTPRLNSMLLGQRAILKRSAIKIATEQTDLRRKQVRNLEAADHAMTAVTRYWRVA